MASVELVATPPSHQRAPSRKRNPATDRVDRSANKDEGTEGKLLQNTRPRQCSPGEYAEKMQEKVLRICYLADGLGDVSHQRVLEPTQAALHSRPAGNTAAVGQQQRFPRSGLHQLPMHLLSSLRCQQPAELSSPATPNIACESTETPALSPVCSPWPTCLRGWLIQARCEKALSTLHPIT